MEVRKMVERDAFEASEITEKIMSDTWEKHERDYYPRRAVDFDISTHSEGDFSGSLKSDDSFSFVAEEEGKIIGVVSGRLFGASGLARLGWLGVLPEYQRRGAGRKLLESVIEFCRGKGCHKITLYTLPS